MFYFSVFTEGMPPAGSFLSRERKEPKSAHRGCGPYVPRGDALYSALAGVFRRQRLYDWYHPIGAAACVWLLARVVPSVDA